MKKIFIILIVCFSSLFGYSQEESGLAVRVIKRDLDEKTDLSEYYSRNGIYLIQNGIYHFRINRRNYRYHRIVDIQKDSIHIAWAMDSVPVISFHLDDINRIIFPSLHKGLTGWPHPSINKRKYEFDIIKHKPYKLEPFKLCKDENCDNYYKGYGFMTSGYGWKPVFKKNGKTILLDEKIFHELKK